MAVQPPPEEVEEGSEPWMGSFADMMSLLLGFFMILYSMSHMDEKKFYEFGKSISSSFVKETKTEEETEIIDEKITIEQKQVRSFQMLVAILNLGDPDSAVRKVAKAYENYITEESVKNIVKQKIDPENKVKEQMEKTKDKKDSISTIVIPASKIFKPNSTELMNGAEEKLKDIGAILSSAKDFVDIKILVHSSATPLPKGSRFQDKLQMTSAQAQEITRLFIDSGIPGQMMFSMGRANFNPVIPEYNEKGVLIKGEREENQRIEIILEKKAQ